MVLTRQVIQKVWGREEIVVNTDLYCSKFLILEEGFQCSLHHHKDKDETFYLMSGKVELEIDNGNGLEIKIMEPGMSVRVVPGTYHRFKGLENSVILETSTHDDPKDSYRVNGEESRRCDYAQ